MNKCIKFFLLYFLSCTAIPSQESYNSDAYKAFLNSRDRLEPVKNKFHAENHIHIMSIVFKGKTYEFILKKESTTIKCGKFSIEKAINELQLKFKDKFPFSKEIKKENIVSIHRDKFFYDKFFQKNVDIWFFEFDVKARHNILIRTGPVSAPTLLIPYLQNGVIPLIVKEYDYEFIPSKNSNKEGKIIDLSK